jgi:replicative DNA helicase
VVQGKLYEARVKAEASTLSAWFYDERFRAAFVPPIELFSLPTHRAIAEICADRGTALTPDGLVLELQRRDRLKLWTDQAEGALGVIHGTPAILDPWRAVDALRELASIRALQDGLQIALAKVQEGASLSELQEATSAALRSASDAGGVQVAMVQDMLARSLERATTRDRPKGCVTGSSAIDRVTGGIRPKFVWVMGADTSWGKSSWVVMVSDLNLARDRRPLIVSGEDEEDIYADRLATRRARINAWRYSRARMSAGEIQDVTQVVADAERKPLFLPGIGRSAEKLAADIRSMVRSEGVDLVFVDYLQAFGCAKQLKERRLEVAYIARTFTDAIKQSGAAGVLMSQITVDPNKKRPDKHSIRESRDVSNAAEAVLLGYAEEEGVSDAHGVKQLRDGEPEKRERKMLFLDKNKAGPRNIRVELGWNAVWAGFEADADYEQQAEADPAEDYDR